MRYSVHSALRCTSLLAILALGGCASLMPPASERIAALPIIEVGAEPPQGEFVLKIPAGKAIPIKVTVDGNALSEDVRQTANARVPQDIYIYGEWVSNDGRQWQRADKVFAVRAEILLPSTESPQGGQVHLTVDRKSTP